MPAWQERLGFSDVALGDTLSLSIFDHKKLTSDLFLGQVGGLPWWGCLNCKGWCSLPSVRPSGLE